MTVETPIYMDHNATTPLDKRVLEAMMPYLTDRFGNAASKFHTFGEQALAAVEAARAQVAEIIAADADEIIFTSGATESNNLAVKGVAEMYREKGNHIITCLAEHKAVIDPCRHLESLGWEVTWLKPDEFGRVSPQQVAEAITDRTVLITLMAANNETGTLHPIEEIGRLAKGREIFFHSDATQAVGKIPVNVESLGVDLLSVSAHKLYGPKGVGCLYVRGRGPKVRPAPQMHGGGHERGMRSGTLNVPGIVGFGAACDIAAAEMGEESQRLAALRDRLQEAVTSGLKDVKVSGHPTERLANTLNVSFAYAEGETIVQKLAPVAAVSTGSACSSETLGPSHVLSAMGLGRELSNCSIRFSLGRCNTAEQVDLVATKVIEVIGQVREMSPVEELREMFD